MSESFNLAFVSTACKSNEHDNCHGKWYGYGFDIICECRCHKIKIDAADGFLEPESATSSQLLSGVTNDYDQ